MKLDNKNNNKLYKSKLNKMSIIKNKRKSNMKDNKNLINQKK